VQTAVELRPATDADLRVLAEVQAAQDTAWWGSPDGNDDDMRAELDRVRMAAGSLDQGSRVAVARRSDGEWEVVGFGFLLGHGQTDLAVDPSVDTAGDARRHLVRWLIASGASVIDAPSQDRERLALLAELGWHPRRSSFELQRDADIADLGSTTWPPGIAAVPFRRGIDDADVHEMIYSVWGDVAGHTHRPFEEWRALFVGDAAFVPELAVLARRNDGAGPVAGVAMCRMFTGAVGWVSQLAVGRPDRGVGLGRSLLVESFQRLVAAGAEALALDVEANNAAALGLYRSIGLDVVREWLHCSPD
jgi:ribosomal protein S18 acetylase RimI-like enzyme